MQEHVRELVGALVLGISLRLEIPRDPETQRQVLVMAMPPDYMDGGIAGEHEISEDTDHRIPDLGRRELQQASSLGSASS